MSYHGLGIATAEERAERIRSATEEERTQARVSYAMGEQAYNQGRFIEALASFNEAYATVPVPEALVAIGTALYKLGRTQEAKYRFDRYLRENPTGSDASRAREYSELAARFLAPASPPVAELPPDAEREVSPQRASAQGAMRPPPNPYARRATIGVWVATGAGVLGLVGLGWWLVRKRR